MSTLIVEVCEVKQIENHPNADKLDILSIKGWTVVSQKGQYKIGDKCVYIPPDTVIPEQTAINLNIEKYLQPLPKDQTVNKPKDKRVKVVSLRNVKSFGLVIPCENSSWEIGQSVVDYYGFYKYDPPMNCLDGDAEKPHNNFIKYTKIEHYNNFPDVFAENEEVIITEKLHGMNSRIGMILDNDENGNQSFKLMVGSHEVRRKEYSKMIKTKRDPYTKEPILDENGNVIKVEEIAMSKFWLVVTENIKKLLNYLCENKNNVIIFGEIIGEGIQDMTYGKKIEFRAFDLNINGNYLDYDKKAELFNKFDIPMVPVLYNGCFNKEIVKKLVDGDTTLCKPEENGKFKGREGIVITSKKERLSKEIGRVILKVISFDYLNRKDGTEYH